MQTKVSHLDLVGRPVIILEKSNVVPEHNQYFQVSLVFYLIEDYSLFFLIIHLAMQLKGKTNKSKYN